MDTIASLRTAGVELVARPCAQLPGLRPAPRLRVDVAPYARNLDRLAEALAELEVSLLVAGESLPLPEPLTGGQLKAWRRMAFACADADVEVVVAETGWLDLLVDA